MQCRRNAEACCRKLHFLSWKITYKQMTLKTLLDAQVPSALVIIATAYTLCTVNYGKYISIN